MTEITTVEELDALPVGSVIRCTEDPDDTGLCVAEKRSSGWVFAGESGRNTSSAMASDSLPATLLHPLPDAPAPSAEDLAPYLRDWRMEICEHFDADICSPCLRDRILAWFAARQPDLVVSAEQVDRAAQRAREHFEEDDAEGPIDCRCGGHCGPESIETHRLHVALAALGIEVRRG